MKLIIGLGNPGEQYTGIRHNLGFEVVDELANRIKNQESRWKYQEKLKSETVRLSLIHNSNSLILILAKPQTFMNNSGMAVKLLADYYKIQTTDIIVIHDDLDLPLGKIKARIGGAAAGHHGVESIIAALNTDQFIRIRLGIGNLRTQSAEHKGSHIDTNKFVLEPFLHAEKAQVKHMVKQAIKAIEILLEKGLETAQNQFN